MNSPENCPPGCDHLPHYCEESDGHCYKHCVCTCEFCTIERENHKKRLRSWALIIIGLICFFLLTLGPAVTFFIIGFMLFVIFATAIGS